MLTENFRGVSVFIDTDAERMFHYYVRPQATGNRTDVRWMQVSDELEKGLSVWGEKPFEFSVSPFTDENIDAAGHINELKRNGTVTVHLDACKAVWERLLADRGYWRLIWCL